jgi:hypothetical protein
MSSLIKQFLINQFALPKEINDIIKDYVFYNIINETKHKKNKIVSLINDTRWSPKNYPLYLEPNEWIFWVENETNPQFQIHFCVKCGDYLFEENNKIKCKCLQ